MSNMKQSSINRTRSGEFNVYYLGYIIGQYRSFFEASCALRDAGEVRHLHTLSAVEWETKSIGPAIV